MSKKSQLRKIRKQRAIKKLYNKKKNMLHNNVRVVVSKGRSLIAGGGLIPKSKKYGKNTKKVTGVDEDSKS